MKWIFAGLCVLLCLSADPWQALVTPFSLLQTNDTPAEVEGLTVRNLHAECVSDSQRCHAE